MLKRILSAVIGAPLLIVLIYLGDRYTAFMIFVLASIALVEYLRIGQRMGLNVWFKMTLIASTLVLAIVFTGRDLWFFPVLVLWFLISFGRLALTYPRNNFVDAFYNFLAVIYPTILMSHLYLLRQIPNGLKWVLFALFLVWGTDSGAYFVGRAFGKHKLAPLVSPKKTVEGALGGLAFSVMISLVFWWIFDDQGIVWYIALGVVVGVASQIGDLFESALKRSAGVKDSGNLIPGHGGILDRFDSFLFVIPIVYYIVVLGITG